MTNNKVFKIFTSDDNFFKIWFGFFVFMIIGIGIVGIISNVAAQEKDERLLYEKVPNRTHTLVSLNQYDGNVEKFVAEGHHGFFHGYFSANGNGATTKLIRFAWRPTNDKIVINEIPITKIQIVIDETITIPTIHFWMYVRREDRNTFNLQQLFDNSLIYATITTPSKYWNADIEMVTTK